MALKLKKIICSPSQLITKKKFQHSTLNGAVLETEVGVLILGLGSGGPVPLIPRQYDGPGPVHAPPTVASPVLKINNMVIVMEVK